MAMLPQTALPIVSASAAVYDRSIERRCLLRVLDAFGTGELTQLIVARCRLSIALDRRPWRHQRLGIVHRDLILEEASLDEADALVHTHLIAVRREAFDIAVVAQGHRVDHERVAFPMPGGIARIRRVVEDRLGRLAAIEIHTTQRVVELAEGRDLAFGLHDLQAGVQAHYRWHAWG